MRWKMNVTSLNNFWFGNNKYEMKLIYNACRTIIRAVTEIKKFYFLINYRTAGGWDHHVTVSIECQSEARLRPEEEAGPDADGRV